MKDLFDIQLYKLKSVLKPYKKDWYIWTKSRSCFLKKGEIAAINWYLETRSYEITMKETGLNEVMLYITIKNATTKLNLFLEIFKEYQNEIRALKKLRPRRKKTGK